MTKLNQHLIDTNKSYFQHMLGAFQIFFYCLFAAVSALIHAIFPFMLETTASSAISKIHNKINNW